MELDIHSQLEEEIFYPAIRNIGPDARKLISEAAKDHREVDVLIRQIDRLSAEDPNFDDRLQTLMELVESHLEDEEDGIFPFALDHCPPQELLQLGMGMEDLLKNRRRRVA